MRAGLKSSLIMQQESSMSRAGSLASDWFYLGRVRPIDEIAGALDALTPESRRRLRRAQDHRRDDHPDPRAQRPADLPAETSGRQWSVVGSRSSRIDASILTDLILTSSTTRRLTIHRRSSPCDSTTPSSTTASRSSPS